MTWHWSVILALSLASIALIAVVILAICVVVSPGATHRNLFARVRGVHPPVRVASTKPLDVNLIRSKFVCDEIPLQDGDRILLKDQPDPRMNGIYIVGQPLKRASDMAHDKQLIEGNAVFVQEGSDNKHRTYCLFLDERKATLGHTSLYFHLERDRMFREPVQEHAVLTASDETQTGTRWKTMAGALNVHQDEKDGIAIADAEAPGGLRYVSSHPSGTGLRIQDIVWQMGATGLNVGGGVQSGSIPITLGGANFWIPLYGTQP